MIVNSHTAPKSQLVCVTYKSTRTCAGSWINRAVVERRVGMWLGGRLDELSRHGWDADKRSTERSRLNKQVSKLTQSRVKADQALAKLASGWASGFIDDNAYDLGVADLSQQRATADARLAELHAELDRLLPADADVYDQLLRLGEGVSPSEYNALVRRVIDKVVVLPDSLVLTPVLGKPAQLPRKAPSDTQVVILEPINTTSWPAA